MIDAWQKVRGEVSLIITGSWMELPAGAISNPSDQWFSMSDRPAPARRLDKSTSSSPAPSHFRSDEHQQEALKETRQPTPFHPTTITIRILNPALPSLLGVSG